MESRSEKQAAEFSALTLLMNLQLTDDIYDYCELMEIGVDTLVHESGPSQIEINLNHGHPELADQAFACEPATGT